MRIASVETLVMEEFPNLTYVLIHTDEGITGLGETYFAADTVSTWIHEAASPVLLGADPFQITKIWGSLVGFVGAKSSGVENRGRSAIDVALWDILGKATSQPIYNLLGGATRDSIPAYNTCAGYAYTRGRPDNAHLPSSNWGIGAKAGPYDDLVGFLERPAELAESLLDEAYMGMKIWPLDRFAEATGGHGISAADLTAGLEPLRKIRERVGDRIEIMLEMHSLWDLPTAIKIAKAAEEFTPYWFEDPLSLNNLHAVARFSNSTHIPTAVSETLGTRWAYHDLLTQSNPGVVIFDPTYAGGFTEAKAICTMADTHSIPIAAHDCVGPVSFAVNTHISLNAPNALVQEVVRAFASDWYSELLTELPVVANGRVYPLHGPGLGTALRPEVFERTDITRRASSWAGRPATPKHRDTATNTVSALNH